MNLPFLVIENWRLGGDEREARGLLMGHRGAGAAQLGKVGVDKWAEPNLPGFGTRSNQEERSTGVSCF